MKNKVVESAFQSIKIPFLYLPVHDRSVTQILTALGIIMAGSQERRQKEVLGEERTAR